MEPEPSLPHLSDVEWMGGVEGTHAGQRFRVYGDLLTYEILWRLLRQYYLYSCPKKSDHVRKFDSIDLDSAFAKLHALEMLISCILCNTFIFALRIVG